MLPPSPRLRRDKSKRGSVSLLIFRCDYLLNQCVKSRIAAEGIEQGIYFDPTNVGAVPILVILFQPMKRLILLVETETEESSRVTLHVAALTHLVEIGQSLQRHVLVAAVSFG